MGMERNYLEMKRKEALQDKKWTGTLQDKKLKIKKIYI